MRIGRSIAQQASAPRALIHRLSGRFGDLHLLVEIVGDEVAHDLVEIAVHLETESAGTLGIDALGPAVADLLDRRIVLPDHLADLAVAGMA